LPAQTLLLVKAGCFVLRIFAVAAVRNFHSKL